MDEEIKTLDFTQKQAEVHVVALHSNLKRLKRSLENAEYKLNNAERFGDKSAARHFRENRDYLQNLVDDVTEELNTMRDLFGSTYGLKDDRTSAN